MSIAEQLSEALLAERATASYERIEGQLQKVGQDLRSFTGWSAKKKTDDAARRLATNSKTLHDMLDISAENPVLAKILKRKMGKIRNFKKVLTGYAKLKTADETIELLKGQRTRSKDALDKFLDWANFLQSVIRGLDSEVEGTQVVGPFRVTYVTAHQYDWDAVARERIGRYLRQTVQRLNRVGMGKLAYGAVFAYPSKTLPAGAVLSGNALASYHPKRDTVNIASGDEKRTVNSLVHELGHRAYFRFIGGRGRIAWTQFFDSKKGPPDVDGLIAKWEEFDAAGGGSGYAGAGTSFAHFITSLHQAGKKRDAMFMALIDHQLGFKEKLSAYTGKVTSKGDSALAQFRARKGEVKVFLHPVTAYSGVNPEELFAETFAEFAMRGPHKVPPIVRVAFERSIPSFKV